MSTRPSSVVRNHPRKLSITHKLRAEGSAKDDIGQAREPAPDDV